MRLTGVMLSGQPHSTHFQLPSADGLVPALSLDFLAFLEPSLLPDPRDCCCIATCVGFEDVVSMSRMGTIGLIPAGLLRMYLSLAGDLGMANVVCWMKQEKLVVGN